MKNIVITGGSGGMGRAAARLFAQNGCQVFSLDMRCGEATEGVTDITADVTDRQSLETAAARVAETADGIDALITFAGIYMMDSFAEISEERLDRIIDINLSGVIRTVQVFLPLLLKNRGRLVITTSELAGQKPLPFNGIYSLSKTALACYTDSLRAELGLLGIRVIELRPGAFATGLIDVSGREMKSLCERTRLYPGNTEKFRAVMDTQTGTAKNPVKIARTVYKAVFSPHPHLRYTVNAGFLLKLWNLTPRRVGNAALRLLLNNGKGESK